MTQSGAQSAPAARLLSITTDTGRHGSEATMVTPPTQSAVETTISILSQSGSRTSLTFSPFKTVLDVKSTLVASWPADFGESPVRTSQLRLIHAGKILEDTQLVESLKTPEGLVVVHAGVRPASLEDAKNANESKKTGCCVIS